MTYKSFFLTTLLSFFMLSPAYAKNYVYLGGAGHIGINKDRVSLDDEKQEKKSDLLGTNIRLGVLLNPRHRIECSQSRYKLKYDDASVFNTGTDTEEEITGINLNYIYVIHLKDKNYRRIKPFVMAGAGYYTYLNSADKFKDNKEDLEGVALNLGLGFYFLINDYVELDLAYKGHYIKWANMTIYNKEYEIEFIEEIHTLSIGINLKF